MNDLTPMRKGRKSSLTKGRQLEDTALDEVRLALAGASLARDLLIENLHKIQDMFGCIEARHIRALAEEMRIGQAEIYEVASFYDNFDVIREDDEKPAPLTIRVCDSLSCMMNGAEDLIANLSANANPNHVRVLRAPCMGRCAGAPAARIGDREVDNASAEKLLKMSELGEFDVAVPDYINLHAYQESGGYQVLDRVRANELTADMLIETLSGAGLRGLGGAGFPAGKKWGFVKGYPGPRLMTINGDEGEPGTFKDRYYLESDPHRMFEGAIVAAHAVEATRIYLYMRDEYPAVLEILRTEIAALEEAEIIDKGFIELRRGAGAYICGEESAMIESIEGKRGLPRHRPPYIAEVGLFGRPTLNHNVETLWWIRDIVENGPQWFEDQGKPDHPGIRSWSVSGRVKEPGVKQAPAGVTVRELIDEYCGGMADGHKFKAYLPGGASGGILPASMDDIPLDFGDSLFQHGAFVGSHAVVILSDQDNIKDAVINLIDFFAHESCGQCTPCRSGTEKLSKLLRKEGKLDEETIRDIEQVMRDASICGLGQAAPNPVNHLLTHFREDL
ncbi:NADH-ubiquinone oxidoreductase-F iron-sulfur binding region domain-containing protein [Ahrensia sp. 13_GOM-1096m]|uniref:NADH-ubiquinone oxidoreductase-F iron-sulfur binding region domain-containing protein n=1 Tax=Ahrensia sp. 13_GOM-1096m TaxID=1380380 RepID=UPI00047B8C47|nr:NADH-ubiquinone oxidoreductase-F iron-sulfur binding region domain-containing protein [Ahrensia sp. 13_GOM-1096m]